MDFGVKLVHFVLFFVVFALSFKSVVSDVIAKSSLQICENTGDSEDPFNVVDQKACEKKLIVTLSVRSGQNGTEFLKTVTNVSKVYDQTENEMARLYNPFVITLAKTPVTLTYPYYYLGTVNNKPKEEVVIPEDKNWHAAGSYHACSDAWDDDDAACGFAKDQQDKPIWDSQGFCCRCTEQEKWRGSFDDKNPYSRSGIDCKLFGKQAGAHCMKYDDLWYTVNEIGLWQMDFSIHVYAYDQVIKKVGNKTITEWVEGGEIVIGPSVRTGRGKYGRIYASFIGEFQSHKQFPVLSTRYLLVPYASDKIDPKTHPQFRNGAHDYMIIDKHQVNYKSSGPHQCDKIGVTYSAFRAQAPMGCSQKQQSCLNNQPKDYFEEDTKRREKGQTPHYFPEKFGKLLGVRKMSNLNNYVLTYEVDEVMTSMVTLQISADDIILIYNRATGRILRAYAQDFQALSRDGNLYVIVQNTGLVTADFYVIVKDCSVGILNLLEKAASINPQQTHTFTFNVKAQQWKGGINYCITQLFDARRKLIDSSNVTFKTTEPCVCATSCGCSCFKEGFKCVERDIKGATKVKPKDSGLDLGFFPKLWNNIKNIWETIVSVFDLFAGAQTLIILIISLLSLGGLKAFLGMRKIAVSRFGMGGAVGGRKKRNAAGQIVVVEYNENGDGIDPHTKEVVEPRNKKKEILFNLFFFFILPFLLIRYLVQYVRTRIRKQTDGKEEAKLEEEAKLKEDTGEESENTLQPSEDADEEVYDVEMFTAPTTIVYHKYSLDDYVSQFLIVSYQLV
uniref:Hapless 2 n=1 Tax=Actinia equina TaxID=6106 RepID=A0A6C0WWB8_ACTEQ|nr:hapless 2 [Actinia equina]